MPRIIRDDDPIQRFRSVFTSINAPKGGLPTMPIRMTDLSSEELGNIMSRYSAWREFTEDRHCEACAVYSQVKSEYDLQISKEMLLYKDVTVSEKKARARTSQNTEGLAKKLYEAEIYMTLLASKLESFTNVLNILSRELTRRGVIS